MIPRYAHALIDVICGDKEKLERWQRTELAVIGARSRLGLLSEETHQRIHVLLSASPPDVDWWLAREAEVGHDYAAFVDERQRHLPAGLQSEFHKNMTSYDGEESAFALALLASSAIVRKQLQDLFSAMRKLAFTHRYTLMLDRTHGQWAKLRSFGSRVLTWIAPLTFAVEQFDSAALACTYSRISGAIGNYGSGLSPEIEREALAMLGLEPFPGATQIMPREIYAPLAQSLLLLCESLGKIALDVRLGARSGFPLYHEPFGSRQKGSSAMPHKKNTIATEQVEGMVRLARGYVSSITSSIATWEARAIEQSCVERVAWPDLFHVTLRIISVMQRVLGGLVVYPDNMLREVVESRGTFASDEARDFLAQQCGERGIPAEVVYRIVQLASFCVFEPVGFWARARTARPESADDMDALLLVAIDASVTAPVSIKDIIAKAGLFPVADLEATSDDIAEWNDLLRDIFSNPALSEEWQALFRPSHVLAQEEYLFAAVLG